MPSLRTPVHMLSSRSLAANVLLSLTELHVTGMQSVLDAVDGSAGDEAMDVLRDTCRKLHHQFRRRQTLVLDPPRLARCCTGATDAGWRRVVWNSVCAVRGLRGVRCEELNVHDTLDTLESAPPLRADDLPGCLRCLTMGSTGVIRCVRACCHRASLPSLLALLSPFTIRSTCRCYRSASPPSNSTIRRPGPARYHPRSALKVHFEDWESHFPAGALADGCRVEVVCETSIGSY